MAELKRAAGVAKPVCLPGAKLSEGRECLTVSLERASQECLAECQTQSVFCGSFAWTVQAHKIKCLGLQEWWNLQGVVLQGSPTKPPKRLQTSCSPPKNKFWG